jgi:hypothetical protein
MLVESVYYARTAHYYGEVSLYELGCKQSMLEFHRIYNI